MSALTRARSRNEIGAIFTPWERVLLWQVRCLRRTIANNVPIGYTTNHLLAQL